MCSTIKIDAHIGIHISETSTECLIGVGKARSNVIRQAGKLITNLIELVVHSGETGSDITGYIADSVVETGQVTVNVRKLTAQFLCLRLDVAVNVIQTETKVARQIAYTSLDTANRLFKTTDFVTSAGRNALNLILGVLMLIHQTHILAVPDASMGMVLCRSAAATHVKALLISLSGECDLRQWTISGFPYLSK